jgi:hypothetical protein
MDTRDLYKLVRKLSEDSYDEINLYDSMDIELNESFVIETGVVGFMEDGVIVHLDEDAMEFLDFNGVLLESEDVTESHNESPVYNAVLNRITRQHLDLLSKFGPAAVMAAIEEVADFVGEVDEIGTSDVSGWTKQVVGDLEAGRYKHLHEEKIERDEEGNVSFRGDDLDSFKARVVTSGDPFDMIYDAVRGDYGDKIRAKMQEMYDDVVIDSQGRLHPDDDVEKIIEQMLDLIEADHGAMSEGAYSDHWDPKYDDDSTDPSVTPRDKERAAGRRRSEDDGWDPKRDEIDEELAAIKRLAGHEEVNEVSKSTLASYINKSMDSRDSLKKRTGGLEDVAKKWRISPKKWSEGGRRGESYVDIKRKEDNRSKGIKNAVKKLAGDAEVDAGLDKTLGEAEYQGRKVPLGKPMQGDVAKSKVYVKKPDGKVVKVNFGDKNMRIKKSNPARRKSFRARHNCENPGPKWKARYWSCRAW